MAGFGVTTEDHLVVGRLDDSSRYPKAHSGGDDVYQRTDCAISLRVVLPFGKRKLLLPGYKIGHVEHAEILSGVYFFPVSLYPPIARQQKCSSLLWPRLIGRVYRCHHSRGGT
jgi:hypothetical protein